MTTDGITVTEHDGVISIRGHRWQLDVLTRDADWSPPIAARAIQVSASGGSGGSGGPDAEPGQLGELSAWTAVPPDADAPISVRIGKGGMAASGGERSGDGIGLAYSRW